MAPCCSSCTYGDIFDEKVSSSASSGQTRYRGRPGWLLVVPLAQVALAAAILAARAVLLSRGESGVA